MLKTIHLVKLDTGYTWAGNEDGLAMHTHCIIAVYAGHPIGSPSGWLKAHHLFTPERETAIEKLDLREGRYRDIDVMRRLGKRLNLMVSTEQSETKK